MPEGYWIGIKNSHKVVGIMFIGSTIGQWRTADGMDWSLLTQMATVALSSKMDDGQLQIVKNKNLFFASLSFTMLLPIGERIRLNSDRFCLVQMDGSHLD